MRLNLKASFAALAALVAAASFSTAAAPPAGSKVVFKTGAKPTPPHVIASSPKFTKSGKIGSPTQFAAVPTRLDMWGNDQYGDCVTAEECFAKIADNPNVFISEQTCIQWAARHGFLNGADLASVLDAMAQDGIVAEDGKTYKDGPKLVVDFRDRDVLANALYQGRVKIAVAHSQIEDAVNGTNGRNGWHGTNWQTDPGTDHCVSLCGYGPASFLYSKLGVPLPADVPPDTYGYLMFTWKSIGFVSRDSLLAVTSEAWIRQPTTAGYPKPPEPTPVPIPQPEPAPAPAPRHGVPVWVLIAAGAFALVAVGGVVFIIRRENAASR